MRPPAVNGSRLRIVHELPGRLRIRHPGFFDSAFDPVYFEAVLLNLSGIRQVRINPKAASVVIAYDGSRRTRDRILQAVETIPEEAYRPFNEPDPAPDPVGTAARGSWSAESKLRCWMLPRSDFRCGAKTISR